MVCYGLDLKIQTKQHRTRACAYPKYKAETGKLFLERSKSTINILTHETSTDSHNPEALPLQNKAVTNHENIYNHVQIQLLE